MANRLHGRNRRHGNGAGLYRVAEKGDRFRLETVVPASSEYGNLVFETAGLNMTVSIDGKEVWQSETAVPENAVGQTQAIIPLPQNTGVPPYGYRHGD